MNDDHAPDLWLLAGDYLDDELDAAGRSRAEDDPALMAIVDQLRSLRGELRAPTAPSAAAREAAIGAALANFDELHADPVVRPISAGSRRHTAARASNRWLGAVAAAVVVLGGLGVVVSSGVGGGGDDDDAGGDAAMGAPAMSEVAVDDAATRAVEEAATESASEPLSAAESAPAADVAFDAAATTAAPEVLSVAEAGGESGSGTEAPAGTIAASGYTFVASEPIADPAQLAQAAAQLQGQADADQLPNTPETRCGTEPRSYTVLADGLYRISADTVEPILVAVDDTTMTALAVDPDSCATLVETPLP